MDLNKWEPVKRRGMINVDGYWINQNIGEAQIKAFSEAFRVEIELLDARDLKVGVIDSMYHPTPMTEGQQPDIEPQFDEPIRILLFENHYYPVIPRGKYPFQRNLQLAHAPTPAVDADGRALLSSTPMLVLPYSQGTSSGHNRPAIQGGLPLALHENQIADIPQTDLDKLGSPDPSTPQSGVLMGLQTFWRSERLLKDAPNRKVGISVPPATPIEGITETPAGNTFQKAGMIAGAVAAVGLGIFGFAGILLGVDKWLDGLKRKRKTEQAQRIKDAKEEVTNAKW